MTPPRTQPEPSGAQYAAAAGAAGAAASDGTLIPTAPTSAAAIASATAKVVEAVRHWMRVRTPEIVAALVVTLRQQHPEQPEDELRKLAREEADREREFQAKMLARLRRDLPIALQIADPAQRQVKVNQILDRERRYIEAREQAMAERALGAVERQTVERVSPDGAYWLLDENVKAHTLDCVVGSARIAGPEALGAARRPYTGKLVEIVVASGEVLAVTPNHPVLSGRGWLAAKDVGVGDHLFRDDGQQSMLGGELTAVPKDDDGVPLTFEQVFKTLQEAPANTRMRDRIGPLDFHGDVPFETEVDIAGAYGTLSYGLWLAEHTQPLADEPLLVGDPTFNSSAALCHGEEVLDGCCSSTPGITAPSVRVGESLALLGRHGLQGETDGFATSTAYRDPGVEKVALERAARNALLVGEALDGLTGKVATAQVVEVRDVEFAGHVFNAETVGGWYTANGLIVGNCLAVGSRAWPWSVLRKVHPPLHHGCPCRLLSLQEAISLGLMTEAHMPDQQHGEAEFMRLYNRAKALMEAATPDEIDAYLTGLQEAYAERFHPRDRKGRWRDVGMAAAIQHRVMSRQGAPKSGPDTTWWHVSPVGRRASIEAKGLVPRAGGASPNFVKAQVDRNHVYLWPNREEAIQYAKTLSATRGLSLIAPHEGQGKPFDVYEVKLNPKELSPDHSAFWMDVVRPYLFDRWLNANTGPKVRLPGFKGKLLAVAADGASVRSFIEGHMNLLSAWDYDHDNPEVRPKAFDRLDDSTADVIPLLDAMPSKLRTELARQMARRGYGVMVSGVPPSGVKRIGSFEYTAGKASPVVSGLSEATFSERLHPRDRLGRWRDVRPAILRGLKTTVPSLGPPTVREGHGEGTWQWAGGRKVFVPRWRAFDRRIGGHRYTAAAGSDTLYRDGEPVRRDVERAGDPGVVSPGEPSPGIMDRLRGRTERQAPVPPTSGPPLTGPDLLTYTPGDWGQFSQETHAIAASLAKTFKSRAKLSGKVISDHNRYDHSGLEDWNGNIYFGADVEPTLVRSAANQGQGREPSERDLADLYNTYRVQAHEASHLVNDADPEAYSAPGGQVLEEGLAEEVGHVLLRENLTRHGRQDVLQWEADNPDDEIVKGTYRGYRTAIRKALDRAGMPLPERENYVFHLKFQVPPLDRVDDIVREGKRLRGKDAPSRDDVIKTLTGAHGDAFEPVIPRAAAPAPGAHFIGKDDPGTFVVTPAEAKRWMDAAPKGAWTGFAYHDTSPEAASSIASLGPRMDDGDLFWTTTKQGANLGIAGKGAELQMAVRFDKPLVVNRSDWPTPDPAQAVMDELGLRWRDIPDMKLWAYLRSKGYDGMVYHRPDDTWALAFKPETMRVVTPDGKADPGTPHHELATKLARTPIDMQGVSLARKPDVPAVAGIYDGFAAGGLHVEVDEGHSDSLSGQSYTVIEGSIKAARGKPVGYFTRTFSIDGHGKLVVAHTNLDLDEKYQDRGFATAFNLHAEQQYRQMGVDHIEVETTQVGGYAWARAGYEFKGDPVATEKSLWYSRDLQGWEAMMPPEIRSQDVAAKLKRDLEEGKLTRPIDVAGWGRDEFSWTTEETLKINPGEVDEVVVPKGTKLWPGKAFMLGTVWTGVKKL